MTALTVTYIGKAATFALMSGFPLVLLGQWDALWSRVILAIGWAFLGWGMAMYLWSGVLYLVQVTMVIRQLPRHAPGSGGMADDERALGGYSPDAGRNAHASGRADADPGAVAAAVAAVRPPRPRVRRRRRAAHGRHGPRAAASNWSWQILAGLLVDGGLRRGRRAGAVRRPRHPGEPGRCSPPACRTRQRATDDATARRDALAGQVEAERRSRLEGDERGRTVAGRPRRRGVRRGGHAPSTGPG